MSVFTRGLLVSEFDQRDTEQLGDDTGQFAGVDTGKVVVYNGIKMDLAADGNDIMGVVETVEPYTNNGHNIGTVKKSGRARVEIGAGEAGTLSVGSTVIADAQTVLGTAANGMVKGGAGAVFKWVIVWIDGAGTGVAGDTVVIERV